jgi:hypothetical protein
MLIGQVTVRMLIGQVTVRVLIGQVTVRMLIRHAFRHGCDNDKRTA